MAIEENRYYTTGAQEFAARLSYDRDGRSGRSGRGYYAAIQAVRIVKMEGFGYSLTVEPFDGSYSSALLVPVKRASDKAAAEAARIFPAWCSAYFTARGLDAVECTAEDAAKLLEMRGVDD